MRNVAVVISSFSFFFLRIVLSFLFLESYPCELVEVLSVFCRRVVVRIEDEREFAGSLEGFC